MWVLQRTMSMWGNCHFASLMSLVHIPHEKKWIHLFEGATSIIFCVPRSDYDVSEVIRYLTVVASH